MVFLRARVLCVLLSGKNTSSEMAEREREREREGENIAQFRANSLLARSKRQPGSPGGVRKARCARNAISGPVSLRTHKLRSHPAGCIRTSCLAGRALRNEYQLAATTRAITRWGKGRSSVLSIHCACAEESWRASRVLRCGVPR